MFKAMDVFVENGLEQSFHQPDVFLFTQILDHIALGSLHNILILEGDQT